MVVDVRVGDLVPAHGVESGEQHRSGRGRLVGEYSVVPVRDRERRSDMYLVL